MNKSIVIATQISTPKLAEQIEAFFSDSRHDIHFSNTHGLYNCDLIIADSKYIFQQNCEQLLQLYGDKTFLISHEHDEYNLDKFLQNSPLNHLIGVNSDKLAYELAKNINKFISNSIWGIEHYLSTKATSHSIELTNSKDINQSIETLLDEFDFKHSFNTPKDYLKVMANELLTNAFYNTQSIITDRKEKIELQNGHKITLKLGADESFITMSIEDNSGQLTKEKILSPITRAFREKTALTKEGGAGIGLYLTYQHANQLIFNNKKDEKSEIICIIDCNKRYKRYRERITSFHFNEEAA